jgi:hypothetical protein
MPEHDYESIMVRSLVAGIADFDKLDAVSLKRQLDSLRALTQSGMCILTECVASSAMEARYLN